MPSVPDTVNVFLFAAQCWILNCHQFYTLNYVAVRDFLWCELGIRQFLSILAETQVCLKKTDLVKPGPATYICSE